MKSSFNRFNAIILLALLAFFAALTRDFAAQDPKREQPKTTRPLSDGVRPEPAGAAPVLPEKRQLPRPEGYKLLYEQTFDTQAALPTFAMTDPAAWAWSADQKAGGGALELVRQSQYQPAVRSPLNIALIADKVFGDFILEADLIQTGREYGHRDMCLIFGLQNPTNFYYAHIATAADDHAHNVFIVNNAPRRKIAKETTQGVNWGLNVWHRVRLERKLSDATVKVYFDDMAAPIMIAEDNTFGTGYIGFGSFDDTGKVDSIRIWGPRVESKKTGFFTRPAP